jgi:eukaryotic-like serine/threonine-protein kinase
MAHEVAIADPRQLERRVLGGKYELLEEIGAGGMGSVWRAVHLTLGSQLAIKFLHGEVARDAASRARFEREAKLAARLGEKCVNIGRVVDVGVDDANVQYIVMEMLRGEDLETRLTREGALEVPVVCDVAVQLCRALAAAHEEGVVHRDLKPANVFLCKRADPGLVVKLLDFGVAKAVASRALTTTTGTMIGTPQYMSPEQLQTAADVDARADLWAAGAIVYRMLLGREAFTGDTINELAMRVMFSPHVVPSTVDARFGPEFDAFMARALAKKPAQRFQSAGDFAAALERALAPERSSSPSYAAAIPDAGSFETLPVGRARGIARALTGLAAAVAVCGVVALSMRSAPQPRPDLHATATSPSPSTFSRTASSEHSLQTMPTTTVSSPSPAPSPSSSAAPAAQQSAPPVAQGTPATRSPAAVAPTHGTSTARGPNLEHKSAASWKDGHQM